jgi:hypothetical protein
MQPAEEILWLTSNLQQVVVEEGGWWEGEEREKVAEVSHTICTTQYNTDLSSIT